MGEKKALVKEDKEEKERACGRKTETGTIRDTIQSVALSFRLGYL